MTLPAPETPQPHDHSAPASKEGCKCQKCGMTFLKDADLKAHHRSVHQMEGLYTVYDGNSHYNVPAFCLTIL